MKDNNKTQKSPKKELEKMRKELAELKEWEEKYKSLVKASPYAITIMDLKGKITEVSPRTLKLHGYKSADELIGKSVFKLVAYKEREKAALNMEKVLREGHFSNVECTLLRKDGIHFTGEFFAYLIKDSQEKPKAIITMTRDIVRRQKAERAIKRSEEKYKSLFTLGPQAVVIVNMKGVITSCNSHTLKLTGYTRKELVGKNVFTLRSLIKKDIPRFRKILLALSKGSVLEPFEVAFYHRDGTLGWAYVHVGLFEEADGKKAIQAVVTDISKQKNVEMALRESEEKYRTMVEHSLQGIVIMQDFCIVYANEAFARFTGYSAKELLSLPPEKIKVLVHPEDQVLVWERFKDRLAGKSVPPRYEYRGIKRDGTIKWLEMIASRIEYKGKPAVQGAVIDITARKQAEEQIKASLKEKEVMLREIHHRVKNNMQIILSLLRIQSRLVTDNKAREMFKQSQNRIRSMALIHEALYKSDDLANIDFSDYISRMTTHLLSLYREEIGKVRINQDVRGIFLDINKAIPCGLLISELISNALKHAFPGRENGEVFIKMRRDKKSGYTLVVKDSGVGFPEELDFREAKTLGLQLVTDLVAQLHGQIELQKKEGTEFTIRF